MGISIDSDDEKIFNLLETCIFDVYRYELKNFYLPKSTKKSKKEDNYLEVEGKLEEDDIISRSLAQREKLTSNRYFDHSGNLVKDIFLDIFLRGTIPEQERKTQKL